MKILVEVIGSMQTEEAENNGDSIPLSTRGAFRFSAMIEKILVYDHTRADFKPARASDTGGSGQVNLYCRINPRERCSPDDTFCIIRFLFFLEVRDGIPEQCCG